MVLNAPFTQLASIQYVNMLSELHYRNSQLRDDISSSLNETTQHGFSPDERIRATYAILQSSESRMYDIML